MLEPSTGQREILQKNCMRMGIFTSSCKLSAAFILFFSFQFGASLRAQIASFPYFEDFESGPGGWVSGGVNNSWQLGIPAGAIINSPAPGGDSSWVTNLTGLYNNDENSEVVAPDFDFSSLINPYIELDVWWDSEFSFDGAVLQSSINNGTSWEIVGAFGDPNNWYTDTTISGNPGGQQIGWSGTDVNNASGTWVRARHTLTGLGGQANVKLRIAFGSDISVIDDGFAFDNVFIADPFPNDLGISRISGPIDTCILGPSEAITVEITNFGTLPQTGFDLAYLVQGPIPSPPVPDNVGPMVVLPGSTANFTFAMPADLSLPGTYTITAATVLPLDGLNSNDSLSTQAVHTGTGSMEDFEEFTPGAPGTLANGWTTSPASGFRWQVETGPTGSFDTGPFGDHTTGSGIYVFTEASNGSQGDSCFLYSPCLDLAGSSCTQMEVWYHMFGTGTGELHVDIDDGGGFVNDIIPPIIGQQQLAETDPWERLRISLAP